MAGVVHQWTPRTSPVRQQLARPLGMVGVMKREYCCALGLLGTDVICVTLCMEVQCEGAQ